MAHQTKDFDKMIEKAIELGFRVEFKNNKHFVMHPDGIRMRICHADSKGVHDLRRFIGKK
jgi:hypothetical protein